MGRRTILLSYWESPEHLQDFATNAGAPHLAPWRVFIKESAETADVGIWHETHPVEVKNLETVYTDMPAFGVAAATRRLAVGPGTGSARQRLGR